MTRWMIDELRVTNLDADDAQVGLIRGNLDVKGALTACGTVQLGANSVVRWGASKLIKAKNDFRHDTELHRLVIDIGVSRLI